jgi:hypothetical protein
MPHRSPITFWLLLAATISVDAVVFSLAAGEQYATLGYLGVALHALILGQLGIVCIWSALNPRPNVGTQIAPWFAAVLASLVEGYGDMTTFTVCIGTFGLYALLLMAALWLLQRTGFWRRKTGSARTWQFSLLHVLTVMTIIGVLATVMRNSPIFGEDSWTNIIFTFSYVALAVASVIFWSFSWNWFLRLASVLSVSALLGIGGSVILFMLIGHFRVDVVNILHAYYLIQAIVFSMWLGIGPVLPPRVDADVTRSEVSRVQS